LSFLEVKGEAEKLVRDSLRSLGLEDVRFTVEEPKLAGAGDLATNVAFSASKRLKISPQEAAKKIAEKLPESEWFEKVEAHPLGYINFTINFPMYANALLRRVKDGAFGKVDIGRGKKVVLEHTSVNPNKALHIGHARNVVIGDTLSRILRRAGYEVKVLNYIDDTGTQVADVLVGFLYLGFDRERPGVKFDQYCGDVVYVKVNEEYEKDPSLLEKRNEVVRQLEKGGEVAKFAEEIIHRVVREQLKTCWRLGAEYDLLNWESHILRAGYWDEVFERLKEKGLVELAKDGKYAGCWVLKGEGDEKVLVRSDGTAVYAAKDIPYAAWKLGLLRDRFGYAEFALQPSGKGLWTTVLEGGREGHPRFNEGDLAITIIDVRQSRVQRFVALAVEGLGGKGKRYLHLGYEVVALSRATAKELGFKVKEDREFYHMSGRRGLYVNADDILDELEKRAIEESSYRNPEAEEAWLKEVGKGIAVGALRYPLLRQDLDKVIVFDIKEALRLEGDTGPYLQYSLARAYRILEKAGSYEFGRVEGAKLAKKEERDLVLLISKYEEALTEAVTNLSPKRLANYARALAVAFNTFYESCPVLQESDEGLRVTRLALVESFTKVFSDLLYLLGIPALRRI
jgi:arginyl-tRNA synthetase